MKVTKTSPFTGKETTLEIPGLTEQMLNDWKGGMLIQRAMPGIRAEHREFLMTGITPEEWDATFSDRR